MYTYYPYFKYGIVSCIILGQWFEYLITKSILVVGLLQKIMNSLTLSLSINYIFTKRTFYFENSVPRPNFKALTTTLTHFFVSRTNIRIAFSTWKNYC